MRNGFVCVVRTYVVSHIFGRELITIFPFLLLLSAIKVNKSYSIQMSATAYRHLVLLVVLATTTATTRSRQEEAAARPLFSAPAIRHTFFKERTAAKNGGIRRSHAPCSS